MALPDKQQFLEKATQGNLVPVYREIMADQDTPVSAYERLRTGLKAEAESTHTFLLESVEGGENMARYSFLGGNPQVIIQATGRTVTIREPAGEDRVFEDVEPLSVVKEFMSRYQAVPDENLPRFFGGVIGYIGYDAVAQFDKVPLCEKPGFGWPDILLILTDTLVIFDHVKHTTKLVANAFIEGDAEAAYADALNRIAQLAERLNADVPRRTLDVHVDIPELPLRSNMEHDVFTGAVEKAKEYIRAGDIIQVVLSQRFEVDGAEDPLNVYRALRAINPSPYMFCLEFGDFRIAGSSPEVNVRGEDGRVKIRPIAGTRPRGADEAGDRALEEDLLADPKERAEHVMLVDLARNDIGRVCKWGTVVPTDFMIIERYSHVMHIVSNVTGELADDKDTYDLLRATFPAGTLSGAPKIRAMEIIAELETARRGAYGGAIGYFGFDGNHDSCIVIRTVVMDGDKSYVQAGAGIVADSDPEMEYQETRNKARGMLKAIALARNFE